MDEQKLKSIPLFASLPKRELRRIAQVRATAEERHPLTQTD
jgi:hypothetical protein